MKFDNACLCRREMKSSKCGLLRYPFPGVHAGLILAAVIVHDWDDGRAVILIATAATNDDRS